MTLKSLALLIAMTIAIPGAAPAQKQSDKSDLLVRIQGPVTIYATDTVGTVLVIGNDVSVIGSVRELVVINGRAQISGTVEENVFLLGSSGALTQTAHVGKDVVLYRSTMSGVEGTVAGKVQHESGASFGPHALWMLWVSMTLALIVAGFVFGYFFGDSLASVADDVRNNWRGIVVTTVVIVCGLPLAAVLSFMTGIGFVLGLLIMFALIPALSFLGYVVAGASIGRSLLQIPAGSRTKMFGSISIGIVVLQLMAIVPVIGVISVLLGSWFGAAALVHKASMHGKHRMLTPNLVAQTA